MSALLSMCRTLSATGVAFTALMMALTSCAPSAGQVSDEQESRLARTLNRMSQPEANRVPKPTYFLAFPRLSPLLDGTCKMSHRFTIFGSSPMLTTRNGEVAHVHSVSLHDPTTHGISHDSPILRVYARLMYRQVAISHDSQWIAIEVQADYGAPYETAGNTEDSDGFYSLGLVIHRARGDVKHAFVGKFRGPTVEVGVASEDEFEDSLFGPKRAHQLATPNFGRGFMGKGCDPLRIIDWDFALSRCKIPMTRAADGQRD